MANTNTPIESMSASEGHTIGETHGRSETLAHGSSYEKTEREQDEEITEIYQRIDREIAVAEARADRLLAQRAAR